MSHVTRTHLSRSKGQKVKVTRPVYSPQWRLCSGSYSGQRGNVLSVRNCCYVARLQERRSARRREALRRPHGEEKGGAFVSPRAQLSLFSDKLSNALLHSPPIFLDTVRFESSNVLICCGHHNQMLIRVHEDSDGNPRRNIRITSSIGYTGCSLRRCWHCSSWRRRFYRRQS